MNKLLTITDHLADPSKIFFRGDLKPQVTSYNESNNNSNFYLESVFIILF